MYAERKNSDRTPTTRIYPSNMGIRLKRIFVNLLDFQKEPINSEFRKNQDKE